MTLPKTLAGRVGYSGKRGLLFTQFERRPFRGHIALVALGVASLLISQRALADDGPILVAEPPKLNFLNLTPPSAWLDLRYFRDDETQKTNGLPASHFTENQFQEILTLKSTGYILHPNVVDLKLQGSFGLEQDLIDESGKSGTESGVFYGWDVDATLFRKEEMPITVYSRRTTSYYTQPFGPSLENTLTTEGIIFDWQNKTVPTRIEYYHLDSDEKALDHSQNYLQSQDVLTWHSRYEPTQLNRSAFDYTFTTGTTSNSANGFGSQNVDDFTNNSFSLSNELDFGPGAKSYLQSSLVYLNDTGTYQLSELRYNETLHLQHTEDFSTNYRYLLDKQLVGSGFGGVATDQLLQRGDVSFTHHLFKSLITTGDIAIQSLSVDPSGSQMDYSSNLNVSYSKIVPFGKLALNMGIGYEQTDNSAFGQETHIVNQQYTFNGALPLIVTGNNIIPDSLIITDSTGIRIYRPGLDYLVRAFPDYLQIERTLSGNIANGQAVLLSYDLAAQPANTLRTTTYSMGGRYDFDAPLLRGLGVYGQYTDVDQSVSSSFDQTYIPASLVDKLIGLDYRIWELKFLVEQDWHHSALAPYDQFRADARWVHPFWDRATFTLHSNYLASHYIQTDDRLTAYGISATLDYQISNEFSVKGSVQWQEQDDKLFGGNRGFEEDLELQWAHRETTAYLRFHNSNLEYNIQSTQVQTIQIGIRRTF